MEYRVMSMLPCHNASAASIKDTWTWIRLKQFIIKNMHLMSVGNVDIKGIHEKRTISIHHDNTWVDVEYISKPRRNFFQIISYIVIMG